MILSGAVPAVVKSASLGFPHYRVSPVTPKTIKTLLGISRKIHKNPPIVPLYLVFLSFTFNTLNQASNGQDHPFSKNMFFLMKNGYAALRDIFR